MFVKYDEQNNLYSFFFYFLKRVYKVEKCIPCVSFVNNVLEKISFPREIEHRT